MYCSYDYIFRQKTGDGVNTIVKFDFYDTFFCTADKCSFTCCKGWDIFVDSATYHKWEESAEKSAFLCKRVKRKKVGKEIEYYLKMGNHKCCPLLDEKGLCNIVLDYGEDYLSKTCKVFPRQKNIWGNLEEYSLSCSCPAVVDLLNTIDGKLSFSYNRDVNTLDTLPLAYWVRQAMIGIMQNSKFSLKDKILLIFHMLLALKKEPVRTKEFISRFQSEEYLVTLSSIWNEIEPNKEDSFTEMNELFLDLVLNYQQEKTFHPYLNHISDFAEDLDFQRSSAEWHAFNPVFEDYENLLENCIVSNIFGNCINDDIDEMIMSFQIIITEYILVKYSVFLQWLIHEKTKIDYSDVRDYMVTYSRIIGYNTNGIIEFWEDSFDDAIWDPAYLLLLIN